MINKMIRSQNLAEFLWKLGEIFVHFTAGPLFHWDVSQKYFHRMIILFHDSGWEIVWPGSRKDLCPQNSWRPIFIKLDESISSENKSLYEVLLNQTKIAGPFFIKIDESISSETKSFYKIELYPT